MGLQPERFGAAALGLLPNPSGLQARYQLGELVELFAELRRAAFAAG
jgi:TDG/mug DNA glycosylase family protein